MEQRLTLVLFSGETVRGLLWFGTWGMKFNVCVADREASRFVYFLWLIRVCCSQPQSRISTTARESKQVRYGTKESTDALRRTCS
jgi:hypothetical protein